MTNFISTTNKWINRACSISNAMTPKTLVECTIFQALNLYRLRISRILFYTFNFFPFFPFLFAHRLSILFIRNIFFSMSVLWNTKTNGPHISKWSFLANKIYGQMNTFWMVFVIGYVSMEVMKLHLITKKCFDAIQWCVLIKSIDCSLVNRLRISWWKKKDETKQYSMNSEWIEVIVLKILNHSVTWNSIET